MASLFWSIATSDMALGIDAVVLVTALIVGFVPLIKWLPVIGPYVPLARLVAFVVVAIMALCIGHRIADESAEAANLRSQLAAKSVDLQAANDAAEQAAMARDELSQQAKVDQERIEKYEATLKARPDGGCALTDDDLRWLHNSKPGR